MRILKLNKVSLTYFSDKEETQALKDISFEINEGEFVSIVGPSGCGKTTILSIISGLIPATNGTIELADKNGSSFVGYMFQKDNLMDWRTVLGNVYLGLEIKGQKTEENIKYVNSLLKKYENISRKIFLFLCHFVLDMIKSFNYTKNNQGEIMQKYFKDIQKSKLRVV